MSTSTKSTSPVSTGIKPESTLEKLSRTLNMLTTDSSVYQSLRAMVWELLAAGRPTDAEALSILVDLRLLPVRIEASWSWMNVAPSMTSTSFTSLRGAISWMMRALVASRGTTLAAPLEAMLNAATSGTVEQIATAQNSTPAVGVNGRMSPKDLAAAEETGE